MSDKGVQGSGTATDKSRASILESLADPAAEKLVEGLLRFRQSGSRAVHFTWLDEPLSEKHGATPAELALEFLERGYPLTREDQFFAYRGAEGVEQVVYVRAHVSDFRRLNFSVYLREKDEFKGFGCYLIQPPGLSGFIPEPLKDMPIAEGSILKPYRLVAVLMRHPLEPAQVEWFAARGYTPVTSPQFADGGYTFRNSREIVLYAYDAVESFLKQHLGAHFQLEAVLAVAPSEMIAEAMAAMPRVSFIRAVMRRIVDPSDPNSTSYVFDGRFRKYVKIDVQMAEWTGND